MTNGTARSRIALEIDEGRCQVCDICLARRACKGNAIRIIDRGEPPFIDMSRCWGCLVCITACPHNAVIRLDEPSFGGDMPDQQTLAARLAELEDEYAERVASLPAHSAPAALLIRIEELEDEIAALRAELQAAIAGSQTDSESGPGAGPEGA